MTRNQIIANKADLSGADLSGANLRGANLYSANLSGANLSGATGYVDLGTDSRGYHFRAVAWEDGWRINAGCRWFTVTKAKRHWSKMHPNKEALARVAILKTLAFQ